MRLGPGFFALFKRVLWPRLWPRIIVLAGVTLAYITYAGAHLVPLALWGVNTSAAQTNLRSVAMTCHSARCGPVSNGQRYWRVTRDFTFTTESGRQIRSQVIQRMASPPTAGLVSQRQVIYLPRNPARHVIGGRPALM